MSPAFEGGEKLKAKLKELAAIAGKVSTVRVGFLEGSQAGGARKTKLQPAPMIAALMEYGHSIPVGRSGQAGPRMMVPPRPFFQDMIDRSSPAWGTALAQQIVATNYDPETTMGRMGELMSGQLKDSIVAFSDPPLAESTIERKGFDKPLIDSGNLLKAVDYEVGGSE